VQDQPLLTVFTSIFLHGGWLHILGNMLFLWIFGDNVEDSLGHVRYAAFYFVRGIAAALAHGFVDPNSTVPAVGASGAIAGVMGAYIVLFPRAVVYVIFGFILIPLPLPAFALIGMWIVLQVFYGWASLGVDTAAGGVAYFAHIGGFVAGAALISVFMVGRQRVRTRSRRAQDFW
jgi:membrane associated rhomboid family serine protease